MSDMNMIFLKIEETNGNVTSVLMKEIMYWTKVKGDDPRTRIVLTNGVTLETVGYHDEQIDDAMMSYYDISMTDQEIVESFAILMEGKGISTVHSASKDGGWVIQGSERNYEERDTLLEAYDAFLYENKS